MMLTLGCHAELNADVEVKRFPQLRFCMVDSPLFVKAVASTSTSAVTSLSSPRLLRVAMGADQFQVPADIPHIPPNSSC
jgi:hypothetical protein